MSDQEKVRAQLAQLIAGFEHRRGVLFDPLYAESVAEASLGVVEYTEGWTARVLKTVAAAMLAEATLMREVQTFLDLMAAPGAMPAAPTRRMH
jgi:hypothetical protein